MISPHLQYVLLPYYICNTSNPYDETEGQVQGWVTLPYLSRSQRLINLSVYNLYRFRIHTIDRTLYKIRR